MKIDFTNSKNTTDYVNTNTTTPATQEAVRVSGGRVHASRVGASSTNPSRITPFNRVITSSRKLYARQLEQNASVKGRCLERNVAKYYDEPDKFWTEFENRKETILDRSSFKTRCAQEGLNPKNVAEHLLFEGNAVVKKTLETGFAHLKGQHLTYANPITTRCYRVENAETGEVKIINRGIQIPERSETLSSVPQLLVTQTA